jgi:hypothetical protein
MLWYCEYTWQPGVTAEKVRARVLEQHEAGTNQPQRIRGWYALAGGGAGFMLVETDDPRELTSLLQPYMDVVSWDVRAIYELKYDEAIDSFKKAARQAA